LIAEIIPQLYDAVGHRTNRPISRKQKKRFESSFPMARFLSEPLQVHCKNITELRKFLRSCKYVSDKEQFNREDYWLPPEQFEILKKGDCDCFAIWTWRQLLEIGYNARFVVGVAGKYGNGHAWITFEKDGKFYILEPQAAFIGEKLPRLSFARYKPTGSVSWDGKYLHYYTHEKKPFSLPVLQTPKLIGEYLLFWSYFWLRVIILLPYFIPRKLIRNRLRKRKSCG